MSWQKAIILWFQGKVEIIEHHDAFVHSVSNRFQLPSIVRLKSFVRIRNQKFVRFCRENIYKRDGHRCQYCGRQFGPKDLTLDHVIPVSRGGIKSWTNIVTACRDCNQRKANKTPREANMELSERPVEPTWLSKMDIERMPMNSPPSWLSYLALLNGEVT